MKKNAVVLLSGGVDSTTCLAAAVEKHGAENVFAVILYYGQKHDKEVHHALEVAKYYNVQCCIQEVAGVFSYSDCPLLKGRGDIEHSSYAEQIQKLGGEGTVATYVPFRNGLFLAYAAAQAVSIGATEVYYGAHADDAAGRAYPDCTPEFYEAMSKAIYEGSGRQVTLVAPLINMNKTEVVAMGLKLKAPYHLTWSCYEGGDTPCGKCGTCLDRKAAFEANGVEDPSLNYVLPEEA